MCETILFWHSVWILGSDATHWFADFSCCVRSEGLDQIGIKTEINQEIDLDSAKVAATPTLYSPNPNQTLHLPTNPNSCENPSLITYSIYPIDPYTWTLSQTPTESL